MARRWSWNCGWEAGTINRSGDTDANKRAPFSEQDIWDAYGGSGDNPLTANPRSGKYYCRVLGLGLGIDNNFRGHYVALTDTYAYYFVPFLYSGASVPGNIEGGDKYVIARIAPSFFWGTTGSRYWALALNFPTTDSDLYYNATLYTVDGPTGFPLTYTIGATTYAKSSSTWMLFVLQVNRTTYAAKLFVNGKVAEDTSQTGSSSFYNDACMVRDNRFVEGKGTDANLTLDVDDWGTAEGSVEATDRPGVSDGKVILCQPNADVLTGWTPSGWTDHYKCVDDKNETSPECDKVCDYVQPGAAGQTEAFGYTTVKSGTVEGARIIWEQHGGFTIAMHALAARLDPGDGWTNLTGALAGQKTCGVVCGGGGTALAWHGRSVRRAEDIKAGQGDWDATDFGNLEVRWTADDTDGIGEAYVMAVGNALVGPDPTLCPAAAVRRRLGQVI